MRISDRTGLAAAFALALGVVPAFAFEGTPPPDVVIVPAPRAPAAANAPAMRRAVEVDVPRPPAPIPRAAVAPVIMPDASLPRPNPMVPPPVSPSLNGRPALPPPNAPAFAAPVIPVTPFEAFRSGARALRDGHKEKALVSLEYAADQGLIAAQWKLGRMYAEGDGVDRSDLKAFDYFSRIADAHADDNPGTPQARYVANAFVALGHYYRHGIEDSDVKADLGRARDMYAYAASYFGDPDAQYNLARMMLEPNGPYRNPRQAVRWLHAAANKGQAQAQALLGRTLFRGEIGMPRQAARGLMWLTLARSNASPSDAWIADLYDQAFKQANDDERALAGDMLMRWMNGRRD